MTIPTKGSQTPAVYTPSAPPVSNDPAALLHWLRTEFQKLQEALKRADTRLKAGGL